MIYWLIPTISATLVLCAMLAALVHLRHSLAARDSLPIDPRTHALEKRVTAGVKSSAIQRESLDKHYRDSRPPDGGRP